MAIIIHGVVDSIVVILITLGFGMYAAEFWAGTCATVLLIFSIKIKNKFKGDVSKNEKII